MDVALELGIPIGGYLPKGRKDENGDTIPDKYANMQETDADDVNVRTELNVQDSDATLIFSHGALFGGSDYTERMARMHRKPCLHVDFDRHDADQAVRLVRVWLSDTQPGVLNVRGLGRAMNPEIYSKVRCVLSRCLGFLIDKDSTPMNRCQRTLLFLMFVPLAAIVLGCGKAGEQDLPPSRRNRPWPTPWRSSSPSGSWI